MDRFVLTNAQWAKMEPHCLGKPTDPGRSGSDNRRFVEAVLWIVRTGSPWRDLPPLFGNWNTVFKRYHDWVKADVFTKLFEACSDAPDMEYAMVDATIVKVHRHGQGAKGGLTRISHTTRRALTVWATGSRFRVDFVFRVRSDRSARAERVSASKVARLAGGDGRAGSVCGSIGAVGEAVSAQAVSRARCAVAKTALYGQPEAMANLIRRTLMVTRAPILKSLRRMVPQVASARSVACRARRRVPSIRT